MANLIRGVLANARNRVSRLLVPLSQQPSSPKPVPRQQRQDEEIFEQDGFYHPVSLGDTFDSGRYSILRKLGYGRYSTVWLARDLKGIWTLEDDHLAKIVEILGSIPPSLLMKGRRTAELLDEQGKFLRIPKLGLASLERVLNGDIMPLMKPPDMPDDEIDVFIDFVRGMLQIDPMARKSAAQLLQHEWLS
ncbi:hypothetical protein E4U23_008329 [Claviceps purpurea]|nr:hypothetical protein E4U23_008329 [Claviceps purpurea]